MYSLIKKFGMSSEEFAGRLLQEKKVAVVPGNALAPAEKVLFAVPMRLLFNRLLKH